jgi:hypothetical protein
MIVNQRKKSKYPPIIAWIIAVFLTGIIILLVVFLSEPPILKYLNAERLIEPDQTGIDSKKVIIIGSSIVRRAVLYDDLMDSIAEAKNLDNYSINRFVIGGGRISFFMPLLDRLLDAKPHLIIIQNSMIIYGKNNYDLILEKPRYYYKEQFCSFIGIDKYDRNYYFNRNRNKPLNDWQILKRQSDGQTPSNKKKVIENKKKYYINQPDDLPEELDNFLIKAKEKGIRIIALEIQRSPEVSSYMPVSEEERIALQNTFSKEYGITFLEFPFDLEMEDYLDYNHVVPKVQLKYSEWLIEQLKILDRQ